MADKKKSKESKAKNKFIIFIIIFLIFIFIAEISLSAEVKNFVKVKEDKVFLSDCLKGLSFDVEKKASEIMLSFAPNPGEERVIKGNYLRLKIKQLKELDLENIDIPEEITLYREYQSFDIKNIYFEIKYNLENKIKSKNYSYSINNIEDRQIKLPLGKIEVETEYNKIIENIAPGKYRIMTEIKVNGESQEKINIEIDIGRKIFEYQLKKDVLKGEFFYSDIVEKIEKIVYRENEMNQELNIELFEGKVFVRNMRQGAIINTRDFERNIILKRNDTVTIYTQSGGITITSSGKALENGYEGENIKVLNQISNKIITGIVEPNGTVRVTID